MDEFKEEEEVVDEELVDFYDSRRNLHSNVMLTKEKKRRKIYQSHKILLQLKCQTTMEILLQEGKKKEKPKQGDAGASSPQPEVRRCQSPKEQQDANN
jgi:hypothetical protein